MESVSEQFRHHRGQGVRVFKKKNHNSPTIGQILQDLENGIPIFEDIPTMRFDDLSAASGWDQICYGIYHPLSTNFRAYVRDVNKRTALSKIHDLFLKGVKALLDFRDKISKRARPKGLTDQQWQIWEKELEIAHAVNDLNLEYQPRIREPKARLATTLPAARRRSRVQRGSTGSSLSPAKPRRNTVIMKSATSRFLSPQGPRNKSLLETNLLQQNFLSQLKRLRALTAEID